MGFAFFFKKNPKLFVGKSLQMRIHIKFRKMSKKSIDSRAA